MGRFQEGKKDLSQLRLRQEDAIYLWRKISAAGEMKTAIKNYLDKCPSCVRNSCAEHKYLRRTMQRYINVSGAKKERE